ncbi:MAG: hypothetical protein O3A48_05250 [Actinomycetota bacterium]|nr:hypothetical protein [Actinomycetota bacterium]MDA3013922.1 hypothetical protein [Actinomycetota bacterium]
MKKTPLLYIFAFIDGLSVAAGSLFGYINPKFLSDIFGANFTANDLTWFKFVLLPGFSINILYLFFAVTRNRPAIFLSNILRIITTVGFFLMWRDSEIIRTLLNFMIIHHIFFTSVTFSLYFKKSNKTETKNLKPVEEPEKNLTEN